MGDNKNKQGYQDDSKIDATDPNEVGYAADEFGVTRVEIRDAIKHVGNSREKVKVYLETKRKEEEE